MKSIDKAMLDVEALHVLHKLAHVSVGYTVRSYMAIRQQEFDRWLPPGGDTVKTTKVVVILVNHYVKKIESEYRKIN